MLVKGKKGEILGGVKVEELSKRVVVAIARRNNCRHFYWSWYRTFLGPMPA